MHIKTHISLVFQGIQDQKGVISPHQSLPCVVYMQQSIASRQKMDMAEEVLIGDTLSMLINIMCKFHSCKFTPYYRIKMKHYCILEIKDVLWHKLLFCQMHIVLISAGI